MIPRSIRREDRPTILWIKAAGLTLELTDGLYPDDEGWLEFAQSKVGGYVIRYPRPPTFVTSMWVNEEGLLMGLPLNEGVFEMYGISVVGDVLVYMRNV